MAVIDGIQVSTQVLVDTAAQVTNLNITLDDKLAAINKAMNDLESTWKSDAATEIRSNMNSLKPRFEQYKTVVESYSSFLKDTASKYESTETTITSNAAQFKQA